MQITVTNCRTSLDVVTFRGVPEAAFRAEAESRTHMVHGSFDDWSKRSDAVLLGETLASRRGLRVGDRFSAAGITVYVAGIISSDEAQDQNVAYAHLGFLQSASGGRQGGTVTQFNVRVDDPAQLESTAAAIDELFALDPEPTQTRSEKSFVFAAASDIVQIVEFTKWVGWSCLIVVLALLGNAMVLAVRGRVRDHAVLQTIGYESGLIARMVICEGLSLSLAGGVLGTSAAWSLMAAGRFSLSVEGLSIPIMAGPQLIFVGIVISSILGIMAGLVPGLQVARRDIASCFRMV
jgi:putative ABC transport system permease protein